MGTRRPERILVYRIGELGDTLVALPAMWALRRAFPAAHLTLLGSRHVGRRYVLAEDLLRGAGLFDAFETYPVDPTRAGQALLPARMLALAARLRRTRYDTLAYLAPTLRTPEQVRRDLLFFRLAGVRRTIGAVGFRPPPRNVAGIGLPEVPREADQLLARLARCGVPVPPQGEGCMELGIGAAEEEAVARWLAGARVARPERPEGGPGGAGLAPPGRQVAVGPGSKMPAKLYPTERYAEVVAALIERADVWPIVFGGPEDRALADGLVARWGRGAVAAGALSVRQAVAAMRRCALYVGNDTGTMHLAAAAGIPCVALFSAREAPGYWFPYGQRHVVLRRAVPCEGCYLVTCVERRMECLRSIGQDEVLAACEAVLERR